ncbi:MAG: excisionase family DNA-binding protein [Thioalkalivibrio sp.]|nr:excisionase family DNA-binding protein [Thioalkalivibrio sp.]
MTARQAAAFLGIGIPQVYKLARDRVIPSVRVGRSVRFNRRQLLTWIDLGGAGSRETNQ